MRVMIWYWGRRGGGAQFALGLAKALAIHKDIDLTLSVSAQGELLPFFEELKVPIQVVNTYKDRVSFVTSSVRIPRVVDEFLGLARGADVVVSAMSHLWTPIACGSLKKRAIPFVPVIHDMQPHDGDPALAWDWRLDRELRSARAAVALSATVQHALLGRKPQLPVLRMPLPAFMHKPSTVQISRPKTNEVRFLFFGRIRAYKGLDILRDAFSIVVNKGFSVRLKVVGEGDFQGFAAGLEAVPGVIIENRWVPDTEISTLLTEADVVVLPYSEASQSGIVPQALAMGIPVIGTPVGGLLEQIREGEGGVLASEPNARAFAVAMEYVCSGDVLAQLRMQARSASGYASDWDAAARELVFGLRSVIP